MDFRDSPEDAAFRQEVRDFLAQELPDDMRPPDDALLGVGTGEDVRDMEWLKKLATKNWVAPAWPAEYGGAGLSVMQQFIYNEELARALDVSTVPTLVLLRGKEVVDRLDGRATGKQISRMISPHVVAR